MDPLTILAAFMPLAVDFGKSLIGKFVGDSFKPANITDWLTMQRADIDKFIALNNAGSAGPSFPWVEAIIKLQRPTVAAVALVTWAYTRTYGTPSEAVDNFAAVIGFYLFGDRTLFYARKSK